MISIQRFLFLSVALLILVASVLVSVMTYSQAYHEVDELFDAQLVQNARLIALLSSDEDGEVDPAIMHAGGISHHFEHYVAVQRWSADGNLILASESVPETPLAAFKSGLSTNTIGGGEWHVFTQQLPSGEWLMVAQSGRARSELVEGAALAVISPFLIAIPVVLLLVIVAIRRGLRPLSALMTAVRARDPANLHALDTAASQVRELAPLEHAINQLLAQLQEALAREQRFTADAAHELRTLLTVLKLHADNARNLKDPREVQVSLTQLQAGVDRATRMVAQLLALARIDPQERGALLRETPVLPAVREVLADLTPLAETRQQVLQLEEAAQAVSVKLRVEALDILTRNLVENALRYSPSGGSVRVNVRSIGNQVAIEVIDEGEGVGAELAGRVTERFFRGQPDGGGAGLGLSIVSRILQLSGGELSFRARSASHPACVTVLLPRA